MLTFDTHAPTPAVKIGGAPLPSPMAAKLYRVTVEVQRNAPACCIVEYWDTDVTIVDLPMFRPGAPLEISASSASENPTEQSLGPLFKGEIVAVEGNYQPEGTRAVVVGYDKSHRLHRKRQTRTFLMQSDSMVVQQIAAGAGLGARVDPTTGVHEYLCQHNQTDWEFLAERAREIGFELAFSQNLLRFRKAGSDPTAGIPQMLEIGRNVMSFRPRITSAEQPTTSQVQSWNGVQKMQVVGVGPVPVPENVPGDPTMSAATVGATFGGKDVQTDRALDLQPAAMMHAQARRDHAAGTAFEAEGRCIGNPGLVPGGKVTVQNAGVRFSGSYTLSTVRHVFDEDGYFTHFTISGRHDRSLLGLTRPGAVMRADDVGNAGGARLASPVAGTVSNTLDPLGLGRVKVKFPWLDSTAESHWARVVSAGGGAQRGWQLVPEVGDEVLVAFEHGDVRRPYVLGGLHNARDMPPQPAVGVVVAGRTDIRRFRTRVGHVVEFVDTMGQEEISITTHQGSRLVIAEGPTPAITIADKTGQNEIKIDGAANAISLKAAANLKIEATGNLELKAVGRVTIEGQGGVDIKSATTLTAEGTASTTIKGTTMSLQANGPLTVQGTPIKLN